MTAPSESASSVKLPIYMDNHATTPVDPRVLDAMLPYFTQKFGNAASRSHSFGWEAEQAVQKARAQVAGLVGAQPEEIVFTSGATESNNLALKGVAEACRDKGNHMVTVATEHQSVLDSCRHLEQQGCRITYLGVDADGLISPGQLSQAIGPETVLVSVMYANNEIGVIQPVREIGRLCRERSVLFHSDATQAVGKIPVSVVEDNLDLLSLSAHKIYGPKGAGVFYVHRGVELAPLLDGGRHERGMRSGTLNVPGIVGIGMACEIARQELEEESRRLRALRDRLLAGIRKGLDGVHVNGSLEHRLPGNLSLSFEEVESETLLMALKEVALSSSSACTSARAASSHVLKALGSAQADAFGAVRCGIGRFNTEAEVDYVAGRMVEAVRQLRELSPAYQTAPAE